MLDPILKEQYNILELNIETDIVTYFEDSHEDFDCGQGYYQDKINRIVYLDNKFYKVEVTANIDSAKQDRGDRLFWVSSIQDISYEEIEAPELKPVTELVLQIIEKDRKRVLRTLSENGVYHKVL